MERWEIPTQKRPGMDVSKTERAENFVEAEMYLLSVPMHNVHGIQMRLAWVALANLARKGL